MDFSSVFRDDPEIKLTTPEVTWDLERAAPELLAKLAETEPMIVELLRGMRTRLPVQRRWGFGQTGCFVRPDRHVRALYIDLRGIPSGTTAGGCIALKGSEAACDNLDDTLERLTHNYGVYGISLGSISRPSFEEQVLLPAIERYPVTEGKPPTVHPYGDALEEAEFAFDFQRAHVERYGGFARAPVPLLVFKWPEHLVEGALALMKPRLSARTFDLVRAQVADGLGVEAYYYPRVPLRVMHVQAPDALAPGAIGDRLQILASHCDVDRAIEGWIDLTSRLLALGFVAADPGNVSRGYCLQPQNLVVDGGFVDVNSLRRVATFAREGEFRLAFGRTIELLCEGIAWFLVGSVASSPTFKRCFPDVPALVWQEVRGRVVAAHARGEEIHPWVLAASTARATGADFVRSYRALLDLAVQGRPQGPGWMGRREGGPRRRG